MTTIKDICKATGFSTATVSRVLNDSPLVTPETQERVRKALDKLGYQPNHAARSLKLNRTGMVAVIFPDLDNGFFTDVLRGVDEIASETGVHLLTAFTHGPEDEQELISRFIMERRADALVLMNLTRDDAFVRSLGEANLPITIIDRPITPGSLASVSIDNRGGTIAMTQHLLSLGYKQIAFVAGPSGTYDAEQRLLAYRDTMSRHQRPIPNNSIWKGNFTEESGYQLMQQRLARRHPLPDVIFASNDAMAIGIHQALSEADIRIPEDVALVGFDDMDIARHLGLTTVQVPMRMIGREAARLTLNLIEGKDTPNHIILPTHLVIRTSCGYKETPPD